MRAGEIVAGRFQIEMRAGAGASGTVYRAVDLGSGGRVALKVFAPFEGGEHRARFNREVTLLAGMSHPGIVEYLAHGQCSDSDRRAFLAMEWLEGCTLADRLESEPLALDDAVRMMCLVAEAVAQAHRRGVVHRDLKPANLFLRGRRTDAPVVLDFGLARAVDGTRLTRTGVLLGTPLYMAPEQARGQVDLDPRCDVFALGAILYLCITGRNPFVGEQLLAVLAKILVEEVVPPQKICARIPRELDLLTTRMLAKDPAQRPADAQEVAEALHTLPGDGSATQRSRSPSSSTPGITHAALRPMCVVLSQPGVGRDPSVEVRAAAAELGGRLEALADGSFLVVFAEQSGTEQLVAAARCALRVRDLTGAPVAVAMGRASGGGDALPIGEALDRAARVVVHAEPGEVAIDASMVGALEPRFLFRPRGELVVLRAERLGERDDEPTFLGRPNAIVGREPELAHLVELCTEAIADSSARAAVILAPAGTGKSRLVGELLRRVVLRHPDTECLRASGNALAQGSPFALIAEMIRRRAGTQEGSGGDEHARAQLERMLQENLPAERVAALCTPLCHLLGLRGGDPAFSRAEPHVRGAAMRQALVEWLRAESAAHPLVLVLDDLQWADHSSLEFVDAALRELAGSRLVVLAMGRPETSDKFPLLWKQREVERIALAGLKRNAAMRMARMHLGDGAPEELLSRVVERAAGNAFFLEELIRAAAAGRGDTLPDSVLLVVHHRLDELSAEQKRVLRAASVFGRSFWSRGVAALLGIEAAASRPIEEALVALEQREMVARRPHAFLRGEVEYGFAHALVQEVAYATLTDADRVNAHRLAGEWLEQHRLRDAVMLAEHYMRGEQPAQAAHWFLQGALQALEGSDYAGARARAQRGLACAPEPALAARLELAGAEAENWSARCAEAERAAQRAAALVPEGSALWYRAMDERFHALARLGGQRPQEAGELLARLAAVAPQPGAERDALLCISRVAIIVVRMGRHRMARDLVERIAALAGNFAELDAMTAHRVHAVRALLARDAGDAEGCLQAHAEATRAAELAGDRPHLCLNRVSWGSCLVELGARQQGTEMVREALSLAESVGAPSVIAIARLALAACLLESGDPTGARAMAATSAEIGRQTGESIAEGRALVLVGVAELRAGNAERAEEVLARAVELAGGFPPLRSVALARLAQALLARGDAEGARQRAREARALLSPTDGFAAGESAVLLAGCEVEAACGSNEETAQLLNDALDRLRERSNRLSPSWQLGFLSVSDNARLLELARQRDS